MLKSAADKYELSASQTGHFIPGKYFPVAIGKGLDGDQRAQWLKQKFQPPPPPPKIDSDIPFVHYTY
jgi:hypothetical protein